MQLIYNTFLLYNIAFLELSQCCKISYFYQFCDRNTKSEPYLNCYNIKLYQINQFG
jgi:hypothetical protein